jgi:hypothetical protein
MSERCANCGHERSLHFDPNAYVPGKCNFQYDLCGCRDFQPRQPAAPTTAEPVTSPASPLCGKPMRGLYGAQTVCARPAGHVGKCDPIRRADDWPPASPVSPLATVREAIGALQSAVKCGEPFTQQMAKVTEDALAVLDSLDGTITLSREEAKKVQAALHGVLSLDRAAEVSALLAARIEESK